MSLIAIYANISCSDLETSRTWYATLLGRGPDAEPMEGLVEWHHGDQAGLQLFHGPQAAGKPGRGTLTLIASDLRGEHRRLAGLSPGEVEPGETVSIVRLTDPDGNMVVLAQAGRA